MDSVEGVVVVDVLNSASGTAQNVGPALRALDGSEPYILPFSSLFMPAKEYPNVGVTVTFAGYVYYISARTLRKSSPSDASLIEYHVDGRIWGARSPGVPGRHQHIVQKSRTEWWCKSVDPIRYAASDVQRWTDLVPENQDQVYVTVGVSFSAGVLTPALIWYNPNIEGHGAGFQEELLTEAFADKTLVTRETDMRFAEWRPSSLPPSFTGKISIARAFQNRNQRVNVRGPFVRGLTQRLSSRCYPEFWAERRDGEQGLWYVRPSSGR